MVVVLDRPVVLHHGCGGKVITESVCVAVGRGGARRDRSGSLTAELPSLAAGGDSAHPEMS